MKRRRIKCAGCGVVVLSKCAPVNEHRIFCDDCKTKPVGECYWCGENMAPGTGNLGKKYCSLSCEKKYYRYKTEKKTGQYTKTECDRCPDVVECKKVVKTWGALLCQKYSKSGIDYAIAQPGD